ncbi:MAG TPA: bifunctional YncE family protein/alkaline phosphatase family protein [Amycolatopsis sp.]|nr:bifunctional YncE family protein/alkaline phosphatase family protein [Amycolatopsis sp.]
MRKPKLGKRATVATAAMVAVAIGTSLGVAYAQGDFGNSPLAGNKLGLQPDGSYLMQTGQFVTPVGDVIQEQGRPFGLALSPDGKTAASLNTGGATTGVVTVFDLVNHKVLQQVGGGGVSDGANTGVLYSPDGKHLWLAQAADLVRYDVAPDGTLSNPVTVAIPGVNGRAPLPTGLAWAPDGSLLVTLNANNTLGVIDPATNSVVRQIPVGNVPNSVVVVDGKAYVSNQGGRPAQPGDKTTNSYGTPIVTNSDNAVPTTGSVSEVDLAGGQQVKTFDVGIEPSALLAVGKTVVVANTDSDSVTSIDTVSQQVGRTFQANPAPGAPYGAQPNGLTMLDPTHLAVSLGRANAVAVYGYQGAYAQPSFEGLIPTGSFPSGIGWDSQLKKLVVASEQGIGSAPGLNGTVTEGTGTNPATSKLGYNFIGTVQTIDTPSTADMMHDTQQVFENNQWNGLLQRNQPGDGKGNPVPVPLRVGDPSTIQHVFLIVKENRTYDQVLGDDPRGNGDPSLAQFGQQVTPNTHALATQFPLIDNLYSDGTNSAEGHNWLDQAFVNNYIQQMYGNYTRSYPFNGGDPLAYAQSGFIWSDAAQHGVSTTDWGEYANGFKNSAGQGGSGLQNAPGTWQQWYHDSQVLEGKATGPMNFPVGQYQPTTDIPSLQKILQPNYPGWATNIPDQYRADLFQQDFANYVKNNNLPALNMLYLPDDHTSGTTPGGITPSAQVADNDLALGRVVDQISHSPYWKNTAIFVLEDDTQNGVDHVDGHRNPTLVISPYAAHGKVVDDYYTQVNVVRTIEQILGIPPMNQQDMAAEPMFDAFGNKPDFTPYSAKLNQVPLTQTNPQPGQTTSAVQTAWAQWSAQQNWSSEDMINMAQGNRDVWYASNGFTKPYPGDSAVLFPNQVPGVTTAPTPGGDG